MNGLNFTEATQSIKAKMNLLNQEMIEELNYQNEVYEQALKRPISHDDWQKYRNGIRYNNELIVEYTEKVTEYEHQRKLLEYEKKMMAF